jgi:hypothetical protein
MKKICNIQFNSNVFIIYHNPVQSKMFVNHKRFELIKRHTATAGEISDIYKII